MIVQITKIGRRYRMGIQVDIQGRTLIISLEGELDYTQAERLRTQIDSAYEKSPCKHMVMDMSNISFMDSSGIGMIIGRYKNIETRGGQLALSSMSEPLTKLYEVSGLAKIVLRAATVKDAIELFGGNTND